MKFSTIVATYNRRDKLELCLQALLNQDYPRDQYEVIVVDDGSTDGTNLVCQQDRGYGGKSLVYIRVAGGPKGPATARNLGIRKAAGEIIAFTDSDCTVPKNWLRKLKDGYRRYPEVAGVGGYLQAPKELLKSNIFAQYESYHERKYLKKEGEYLSEKRDEHPFESNNISYKKSVLDEVGGFDESFPPFASGEDGDLKERVVNRGYNLLFIPVKVTHHQDYDFKSFWRRQEVRGAGILKFRKGHRLHCSKGRALRILGAVAFLARQVGKLKYYDKI